jgi:hypothetical protein
MPTANLAIVFGPNVLRPPEESIVQIVSDAPHVNAVLQTLLDDPKLLSVVWARFYLSEVPPPALARGCVQWSDRGWWCAGRVCRLERGRPRVAHRPQRHQHPRRRDPVRLPPPPPYESAAPADELAAGTATGHCRRRR